MCRDVSRERKAGGRRFLALVVGSDASRFNGLKKAVVFYGIIDSTFDAA
jgi:hypothetical protein